jgi:hypothetical protein
VKNIFFKRLLLSGGFILILACNHAPKQNETDQTQTNAKQQTAPAFTGGSIFERITKNNSVYSCYLPSGFSREKKYPAIIFLDPHAKGNIPLEKYKGLAEEFQFMLIGCNSTKNGMDLQQCIPVVNDLMNEAISVLPGEGLQISIAGFSGGAKVALASANSITGFNSVIYCGAAFPPGSIKIKTPCMGIAGKRDMNYTEVRNFNYSLSVKETQHAVVEWNGKHEWPDSATFIHAFYWSKFSSMRMKIIPKNDQMIDGLKTYFLTLIDKEKNPLIKSELLLEEMEVLSGIVPVNDLKKKLTDLNNSPALKNAKKIIDATLANEDLRKSEFAAAFETKDLTWWKNQVMRLNSDTLNESNQRSLGYISLASWSYSTKALEANNDSFAEKTLRIYKLADPSNSEQPFLMACLFAKNNFPDSAIYYLKESVRMGIDDRNKIENEKNLLTLHGRNDFQEVLSGLH